MARNLKANRKSKRQFGFETMESRRLMAADVSLVDGGATLRILGTEAADTATVKINSLGRVEVATSFLGTRTFSPAGITKVTFQGFGGDDTLDASAMRIRVDAHGQGGNDTLKGGSAGDFLYGDEGNDKLYGNGGSDELYGNGHDDLIYGGSGIDTLNGGNGADTLYGQADVDTLIGDGDYGFESGTSQNDILDGGTGRDRLFGDCGADGLYGGSDRVRDELWGGHHCVWNGQPDRDWFYLNLFKGQPSSTYESDQIMDFASPDMKHYYLM